MKDIKRFTVIIAIIAILLAIILFSSCKTNPIYIPVETIKTEYKNKYLRDSIYHYDSIYVKEKGDSVLIEKYKNIYIDRLKTDTVLRRDSVQVPYPIVEYREINKISGWQNFQIWLGRILIVILIFYLLSVHIRKRGSI